ncbi:hypothetical protein AX15_001476 [Amanita polypyramis BW_CC]|nr:hypothetical protein AX15_001476 [Amanita polypyramis BW_CC]
MTATKLNAVVAGQTSVKAPEQAAFEKYLPEDTHIVSCHSLHGPTVSPIGQPLVLIKHRGPAEALTLVENILRCFGSRYVYLSYQEHDLVTANTQAVTHAAFLTMGTAWAASQSYPWEHGLYVGGLETVKVNLTLRIYSNQWHVYAGLAILNPSAGIQVNQYAKSATELFKLMLAGGGGSEEHCRALNARVEWARKIVFGDAVNNDGSGPNAKKKKRRPILLSEDVLDKFSLGKLPTTNTTPNRTTSTSASTSSNIISTLDSLPTSQSQYPLPPSSNPYTDTDILTLRAGTIPPSRCRLNSHLSLLAMVDSWAHLSINPYAHLSLAATPLFRLFLGVAEHLFLSPTLLQAAIDSGLHDTWHRSDDLEFVVAARGWSQVISFGSFEVYRKRFEKGREFLESRFEEGVKVGSEMIKAVMATEVQREKEEEG